MKKSSRILLVAILLVSLFSSCENKVSMLTVIHKDGSLHREVSFLADSTVMRGKDTSNKCFARILESNQWTKKWNVSEKDSRKSKLMCKASRDFASASEMAEAYPLTIGGKSILKDCRLERHFKGFYTDYTFSETYNDFSSLFKIPLIKYLDKEAASYWLTGKPNVMEGKSGYETQEYLENMNRQFDRWLTANIMNDVIDVLVDNYDSLKGIPISRKEILIKRDSLINYASEKGLSLANGSLGIGRTISTFFHSDYFMEPCKDNGFVDRKLQNKIELIFEGLSLLDVDYQLTMPGTKIIDCGQGIIKDNVISFRLTGVRLLSRDYTISASFRSTNYWAFIVTLLVIIIAVWTSVRLKKK